MSVNPSKVPSWCMSGFPTDSKLQPNESERNIIAPDIMGQELWKRPCFNQS